MSKRQVIWPVYLDENATRGQGRIVSLDDAVEDPTLKEIADAAESLDLDPEMEPEKSYPRSWWEESGRVLVEKTGPKSVTVKRIADEIRKSR